MAEMPGCGRTAAAAAATAVAVAAAFATDFSAIFLVEHWNGMQWEGMKALSMADEVAMSNRSQG